MTNKKLYKDITTKEKKNEIHLLKKEIKEREKEINPLKKALEYLTLIKKKKIVSDKTNRLCIRTNSDIFI